MQGEIIIEGNAYDHTGAFMQNGRIIIKGTAGEHIGEGMQGGEIYIGKFSNR